VPSSPAPWSGDRLVLAILGGAALLNAAAALFTSLRTDKTTGHSDPDVQAPAEPAVPEEGWLERLPQSIEGLAQVRDAGSGWHDPEIHVLVGAVRAVGVGCGADPVLGGRG
jgi:hypothetical protein